MLIVLVISSLVIGITFSVLDLVQKTFVMIQDNYAQSIVTVQLKERLSIDFNRYHEITYNSEFEELVLKNPLDSVLYEFNQSLVIRNEDTLMLNIQKPKCYFLGKEVSHGMIDAIKIQLNEELGSGFIFVDRVNDVKIMLDSWE
ncbi:hypothetical protein SAMN05660903_03705 [Salegentibacter salinarum]|nr:hypothetical protein [Salegentibacter salinarum]SKB99497.1 hypothetical protein SAMN05660903_03705 [Salegentibacter salinarum]